MSQGEGVIDVACPRFLRTDADGASEMLTLVQITDGPLAGDNFACVDLDGEYPYLVQITKGASTCGDFVGLYDLDGEPINSRNCQWVGVDEAPSDVVEQIETGWAYGTSTVTRLSL